MPTRDQHLKQAIRNEEFFESLCAARPEYHAWAVTAMFYSAVQYGRALLADRQILITSHQQFAMHFVRVMSDPELYKHYRRLKDESERARYDCATFTLREIEHLKEQHFAPFRDAVKLALAT
jgi:hypothetical protein